jgi:hypothetical protein
MTVSIVVAVHDSALDAYSRPFFVPTTQAAVRSFSDEVNRASPDNPMFAHPEDYTLHQLGTWSDASGEFENLADILLLVRGKDVSRKEI